MTHPEHAPQESMSEILRKELSEFNPWNYIISKNALTSLSQAIEKSPFRRRSASAPCRRREFDARYHPQLKTMLRKWQQRFRKFKDHRLRRADKKKLLRNSRAKLALIKRRKNDELSILNIDHFVQRNLCKDDLFLPRRHVPSDTNSNTLVIKLTSKAVQTPPAKPPASGPPGESAPLSGTRPKRPNQSFLFHQKWLKEKRLAHKTSSTRSRKFLGKLVDWLSICSKPKPVLDSPRVLEPADSPGPQMIRQISYEFAIQQTHERIRLHLLRVRFKDSSGRLVML